MIACLIKQLNNLSIYKATLPQRGTLYIKLLSKQSRLTTKLVLFIIMHSSSHRWEPKKHKGCPSSYISVLLSSKDPAFRRLESHSRSCSFGQFLLFVPPDKNISKHLNQKPTVNYRISAGFHKSNLRLSKTCFRPLWLQFQMYFISTQEKKCEAWRIGRIWRKIKVQYSCWI